MLVDDFERIELLKSNWSNQLKPIQQGYLKRFRIQPTREVNFKLPYIRIKQNAVEKYRDLYPRRRSHRLEQSVIEKPKLTSSRVENILMAENMSKEFEKFKHVISVPSESTEDCTFLTSREQHTRKVGWREELIKWSSRSPLGNAYYAYRALPRLSQANVQRKIDLSYL